MKSENYFTFVFELDDRFGSHGIVSFVILKCISNEEVFIENWAMSCRVLERSFENYIINAISEFLKQKKYKIFVGEYIETKKNKLVENLYTKLSFSKLKNNKYSIYLEEFIKLQTYITNK